MDIVLPLLAKDLDAYLRLQRPTLERYYSDLGTTWILTRPQEVSRVREATVHLRDVNVLDESEIVPELRLIRKVRKAGERDWSMQQLIKLAGVAQARTPFVLVLDADVVAVAPVSDTDLVQGGRALRPREPRETHPEWVQNAARALGVEPLDFASSVTPSVLSVEGVRLLAQHAERSLKPRRRKFRTLNLIPGVRGRFTSWRGRLLGVWPWTEYQLYDTFLVRHGHFDRLHYVSDNTVMYGNCVWGSGDLERWTPGPLPEGPRFFFSVLQGFLRIPVDDFEARLRRAEILTDTTTGSHD